jgi:hypothetical protein
MKVISEIAYKLIEKLPLWLKGVFVLLIMFGIFTVPLIISKAERKADDIQMEQVYKVLGDKLDELIEVTEKNNLDNLSKRGAEIQLEQTLDLSKEIIYRRAVYEIDENHIDKAYRQTMIRDNLFNVIQSLYNNDYIKLNQFSYNKKTLGSALDNIDPNVVLDGVLECMFKKRYDSPGMLKVDLWNNLTGNFESFKIIVKDEMGT